MKAVVKTEPGYDKMELRDVPVPEVYGDRVKIKVAYTGICGSDIHTFKGEYQNPTTPVTLGHEFSGEVVEVGPEVTKFKMGDRVTSETTFETCGECVYCQEHDYNLCSNRKGIGTQANGSFAEYVLSREESCHLLAESISYEAAALTEPLACCVHAALEKTEVKASDTVLIFGPGPIGLLLAQVVKAQGATVIMSGITKDKARLQLALQLGVDKIVDTLTDDLDDIVLSMTDGYGADKVFDCSGAVPAVNQGLPLTKKKGDFVQVGLFAEKKNAIDEEAIIQREIAYIGSRSQKPSSWLIALDLLAKGHIHTDQMITKIYDLDDWREGFQAVMAGNEIKVLVKSN
ncbi:zinc-binding dehydrogenase [Listeria fleischmannii]|uniref:Alcohol dehydrogenase catalytic domain-containing protein n=1 Tax=Listeria fleischmannii TaxID=1069827 RepID=A0A841YCF5_9LIST|nr:zinc-binding dehydrogenase [Listeria fleischmannii]MBC1397975.1 alcohol dehydrogenase catalytic domain-containing protein [Listeria fleischmannii]MBC1417811.1 alcohol dehydrogenase catalytic domain-containing protein [Listeria fleischmannii]MBC1426036.1 alcohol dehydrogenase catalytic domain-containing protein [Listeria fleischmannii]STY34308.1 L-threonine 3-dehydrogenase [Listeria fleischmannii subsp. coloradonensis]